MSSTQPRCVVLHLGLIGLRVGAELLEIVDRQVLARDEHDWDLGDKRDRGEICRRIVQGLLIETLALGMGPDRTKHERVHYPRSVGSIIASFIARVTKPRSTLLLFQLHSGSGSTHHQ